MKKLYEQQPRLGWPGIRQMLIRVHVDLLRINSGVNHGAAYRSDSLTSLEKAVLVLEDRRFMRHSGVDVKSVVREVAKAATFRRHGGASTIDMQFVRTVTGYKKRKIRRKLYEMLLSIIIQFRYSKITILRSYIACAFFGSRLYGADRASQCVFEKGQDELSMEEAVFLAAMLVYPRPMTPSDDWVLRVQRRADYGMRVYVANKERFDQLPS